MLPTFSTIVHNALEIQAFLDFLLIFCHSYSQLQRSIIRFSSSLSQQKWGIRKFSHEHNVLLFDTGFKV